jgi:hypothetical protein
MPTGPNVLKDYLTFFAGPEEWRVHQGIGTAGPVLSRRKPVFPVADFSASYQPHFWVCGNEQVKCFDFAELVERPVPAPTGRLTAVAAAPEQVAAVALQAPSTHRDSVKILRGDASGWTTLQASAAPDISSRLAWIDQQHIAYESAERLLCVHDMKNGEIQKGPPGAAPASAAGSDKWFAIVAGRIVEFPVNDPFAKEAVPVTGYDFEKPQRLWPSQDGAVFTWIEPFRLYRNRGFIQAHGKKAIEIRDWSEAPVFVAGPYVL